ncbi:hypothetical protein Patl1_32264 [Pistacia atlantica]|uniref:Uncharacterized protein n=1 Tax=Pistacia atlantica TaxID=434234 RepID=A0ACC1AMU1_9ROSI|nr:hypothetical protein Patl1_32264 [Pistacia atlantica]
MASLADHHHLHFVLIPFMCPGHLIPMVDLARLLAQHGVIVTLITTPLNAIRFAIRFEKIINRDIQSGLPIRLLKLRFPCAEAALPEGCENVDSLPSRNLSKNFSDAARMLQQPIEKFLEETSPGPSCIVSDRYLPWTINVSRKFGIPRLAFDGTSCFAFICSHKVMLSRIHEKVSDSEYFVVPGLPDRIELTKAQLPSTINQSSTTFRDRHEEIKAADETSYGLVFNSFQELEDTYVEECRKLQGDKIWCIGPVSLCNKENIDKGQRGNKTSIDEEQCLKWLNSWPSKSVVYACLGTLGCMSPLQLIELGLALEASKRPFMWVIRDGGEEEKYGVMLKREEIRKAIEMVMDEEEGKEKRKKAREVGRMAKKAFGRRTGGGSSHRNFKLPVEDILKESKRRLCT